MHKKEKLKRILGIFKDLKIKAYHVAAHTPLTEVGINKIINEESTNPHNSTIDILINYLDEHHGIAKNWSDTGSGVKFSIKLPTNEEWNALDKTDRAEIMSKLSTFIAYHEEEALNDKVLFNIVERNAYKLAIKKMKE